MTKEEISLLAFNGGEPLEMNMPDENLFSKMSLIALKYKSGMLTQAQASEEKKKAYSKHSSQTTEYKNGIEALQRIGELYKALEQSTTAFRKQYNEEAALKVIECAEQILIAFYGATMRKDDADGL